MREAGTNHSYLCVSCDRITVHANCQNCRRPTVTVSPELPRVRESIQLRQTEIASLRKKLDAAQRQQDQLRAKHHELVAEARRRHTEAPVVPPQPVPSPTPVAYTPSAPPDPTAPPAPAPPPPESSTRSIQQLLLWMGAISSAAAIIAFTAVAWATFGLAGRAVILTVITAITMAVPPWVRRRGLTSTAETLAGLAMFMVACDAVAVYYLDVLPSPDTVTTEATGGAATVMAALFGPGLYSPTALSLGLLVILTALIYRVATGLVVPGFAAAALATGVAVLACAQAVLPLGAGAMLAVVALLCGAAVLLARHATTRPQRALVHTWAAVSVGIIEVTTVYSSGIYTMVAVTGVTAGLLAGVRFGLPARWRAGPVAVAGAVWGVATTAVALVFIYATAAWLLTSTPIWNAAESVPHFDAPLNWQLAVAVVFTTIGIVSVLPHRLRGPVAAAGATATVMTLPPALALSYPYAAPLVTVFAILWAALALRRRGKRAVFGLVSGAVLAGYALGLSLGRPWTTLVTLSAIAVTATILACLMWTARRSRMAGFLAAVAIPSVYGAIVVAMHWSAMPAAHVTGWAMTLPALLLVAGTLRHCHWYFRATDARWPLFSLPAATGLLGSVAIGAVLAIDAASSPLAPMGEKFTLAVAAFTAGFSCMTTLLVIIEPQSGRVRAAAAGTTITLIAALAAYGTIWHNDALLWYTVATIVVGFVASALPRHLYGALLGARVMVAATAAALAAAAISAVFVTLAGAPPLAWLTAQTPVLSLSLAAVGVFLVPHLLRWPFALGLVAFAALAAPVVWPMPWWLGPVLAVAIAFLAALLAVFAVTGIGSGYYGVFALLTGGYSVAAAVQTPTVESTAWLFGAAIAGALSLAATVTAALGYRRRLIAGGISVCSGLILLTLGSVLGALGWQLPSLSLTLMAMTAASLGLLIACVLRAAAPAYLPWASVTVPLTATAAAATSVGTAYTALFFATSGLIGVAAAMLTLPNRTAAAIRTGLAATGAVPALAMALPVPLTAYLAPYSWLNAVWTGHPVATLDGLSPPGTLRPEPGLADPVHLAVLALIATTAVVVALGLASRTTALVATAAAIAIVLPSAPLALNLLWPSLPLVTAAVAIVCYLLIARAPLSPGQLAGSATITVLAGPAALSGALATSTTSIIVTTLYSAATIAAALLATTPARRATSWVLAATALTGSVLTAGLAAGLAVSLVAFGVLTVAAVFFALRASRSRVITGAAGAIEISGHAVAWLGLALTSPHPMRLAIALVVYGSLLGLLALLAPRDGFLAPARGYAAGATVVAFGAYWLLLSTADVAVVELYTVPFALATVVAGWLELRRRPAMRSWTAYGAGLCLGFLPSLALVLISPDEPWRRLLLGAGVVVVLCLGAWRRLQAPVVITAILLPVLAIREIAALWTHVPSWLPLAVAGVLLLIFGATFEKRRRDLRQLRESVAAMR